MAAINCSTGCHRTTQTSEHDAALYVRPAAAVRELRLDGPLVEAPVVGCNRHHAQLPQPHECRRLDANERSVMDQPVPAVQSGQAP
jgi:hypothetical protein